MPAEWEAQESILMTFPDETMDWAPILDEARDQFARMFRAFISHGNKILLLAQKPEETSQWLRKWGMSEEELRNIRIVEMPLNDTWTRDYGPISVVDSDGKALARHYRFNGWGGKFESDRDNLAVRRLAERGIIRPDAIREEQDFVFEGGSIESDGGVTLLVTSSCLLNPNRNPELDKERIGERLRHDLGGERVLWIKHGHFEGDDTDGHIDTLARLAPGNTIIYAGAGEPSDPQYDSLARMAEEIWKLRTPDGEAYRLIELPMPRPKYDKEDNRLPATYANYLVTPSAVFVPTYGDGENDEEALRRIGQAFEGRDIVGVDCRTLIKQGGSLHCSTMQLYPGILAK